MDRRFEERAVLVAGGTGALGSEVSLAFLAEGADVVVTCRREEELDRLRERAGGSAGRIEGHEVDVTDAEQVERLVEEILGRHGRLDVLVNAVGGYAGGAPLWETEPDVLDRMLALNLKSGWMLARAAARRMVRQGSGAIVNIASKAAVEHTAGSAAYAASKAAALAMLDCLAADLEGTGVRANSVLPSIFDTMANRQAMPDADFDAWPKPEEIAQVVLFLCSDAARLVHGAAVPVYGAG